MPFQLEVDEKTCDNNEIKDQNVIPKYQNTYRTDSQNPFKAELVDKIVKAVMINYLNELTYDDSECVKLCSDIAAEIRRRVKKLNFDRHKTIVVVTIVEKASQSLMTTVGYLWDNGKDSYSAFTLEGCTFHAHCCVFGLYYE